jgi:uncharacterized membrane protein
VSDGAGESTREADRLINFSDAVVAVAVTLLALPLVDIAGPPPGESVLSVLGDHAPQLAAFLFTFYVVAIMWLAHNRILNGIARYDAGLFWLNTTWLAGIVLLPWTSAMYGESQTTHASAGDASGIGLLYWSTMAAISIVGALIGRRLGHHPELLRDDRRSAYATSGPAARRTALRGPVFAGYFLLIGVVSLFSSQLASWLPLGIIALSYWLRPVPVTRPDPIERPMREST